MGMHRGDGPRRLDEAKEAATNESGRPSIRQCVNRSIRQSRHTRTSNVACSDPAWRRGALRRWGW
jgi:hypothetical protein